MASFTTCSTLFTLIFILLITPSFIVTDAKFSEQFPEPKASHGVEKMSRLHFYFHDIVSGKHPTAIFVAGKKNKFGGTAMIDDPLTEGVKHGSKVVGRAQGMYALSSLDSSSLLMVMNFEFTEGKYNGSSLSVLGRNPFLQTVREMPVVGGSGLFRFARGYALAKTVHFNLGTGDAVVEYNVFVMHH
ncbi:Dirigent protein 21 [Sesamum angolense]|uniref:Dirigent protein n=1 Tax=Sesamum angolense TaxID=2727404 RepID=A0AAE2C3Q8_9LAMI|nr:Dirigent protein 21 [Sesamum angolense]